jgi:hypothetical protein
MYEWNGATWIQLGDDIEGLVENDFMLFCKP